MPTHDFTNIGDVLDFDILRGTITEVDSETDTCTVTVNDQSVTALLFYHCEPDSVLREDNGAIEGAAAGFEVDDEVIVMISKVDDTVKVIAHVDGARHCGEFAVFIIGNSMAFVWDIYNNKLILGPVNTSSEDYTKWINSHNEQGESFLGAVSIDNTIPYKIDPDLADTDLIRYHAIDDTVSEPNGYCNFPKCIYCKSDIGSDGFVGIRTQKETAIISEINFRDSGYGEYAVEKTIKYAFYGPYGIIGEHSGTRITEVSGYQEISWYELGNHEHYDWTLIPPWSGSQYKLFLKGISDGYIGAYEGGEFSKSKYMELIDGTYSDNSFIFLTMIQYVPVRLIIDVHFIDVPDGMGHFETPVIDVTWTFGERVILVQSQAAKRPEGDAWQSLGNNTELSSQIIAAINQYCSENSVSDQDIMASVSAGIYK